MDEIEKKRKRRNYHLRTTYGITIEDYDRMLEEQGGKCAVCGKKPRKTSLAVDHNHRTGKVRGLLCFSCNYKIVGRHNSKLLGAAADYLRKYGD